MAAITPTFTLRLEDRLRVLIESEYTRMTSQLWWQDITRVHTSTGAKDLFTWLLSTMTIKDQGVLGGNIAFDDLVATYTTIENRYAGTGLKLHRAKFEDTDGGGLDLAAAWARDAGAYMAYWPQKQVANLLKNGETLSLAPAYDGKALFASDHPVNVQRASLGTYQNIFTGAVSGAYPGACPIDDSVSPDVALANLAKIYGYIASIKMPNGEDPRFLTPVGILCPPRMFPRVTQLTSAKFIAQAATSGGGAADVERLIAALGFSAPMQAAELAGFESDKTFFVICKEAASSQLGGVVYVERQPFKVNYYDGITQAELDRKTELEWHLQGRNVAAAGHPFMVFKCKGG